MEVHRRDKGSERTSVGGMMLREWLPHFLVSLFALAFSVTGATFLAMSDEDQAAIEHGWSDWLTPGWDAESNSTEPSQVTVAKLPPRPMIVWSTFFMTAISGFYLAAALAGYVHRSEGA